MKKEEAQKKLINEMTKLQKRIQKAALPIELAMEIKESCSDVIEGKDTEKLLEAFLVLAFEMKMLESKDNTDRNAIDSLCKLMKLKSAYTFDTIGAAMIMNSVLKELEEGE